MDAARTLLLATLGRRPDLDLETLSRAIGRNHAYLLQYLMRGSPRELPGTVRDALAARLGLRADDLRAGQSPDPAPLPQDSPASDDRAGDLPVYSAR